MNGSRVTPWASLFVLVPLLVSQGRAEDAKDGPLTVERLREAAHDWAGRKPSDESARLLDELADADEPAILAFLDEESARAVPYGESEEEDGLVDFYDTLLSHLGARGSRAAVPVLVRCLSGPNALLAAQWADPARSIVDLSARYEVTEEDLRPLTGSPSGATAAIGRQVLAFVKYDEVPSDLDQVIACYRRMKTDLEKQAGAMPMWELFAEERGFTLRTAKRGEAVRAFLEDSRRRGQDLLRAAAEGRVGSMEMQHLQMRESYLQVLAIEDLGQGPGSEVFDLLVDVIEADPGYPGITAAFHLHRLTGAHFPLTGHIDAGGSRTNVVLNAHAARAWRKWDRVFPAHPIEIPSAQPESTEARVDAFRRDGMRGSGAEFARDAGEVVEELLASRDRRILEMLVVVLRKKTLAEAQVERLIAVAGSDDSDAHRTYLWVVLAASGSGAAGRYLEQSLVQDVEEGQVIDFVDALQQPGRAEVRLLTKLYEARASDAVRDAIARKMCADNYEVRLDETAQDQFFAWIVEHSSVEGHVLEVVRRAMHRAGTRDAATRLVELALGREWSPAGRRALLLIAVELSPETWLPRALRGEEPEDTRIGALRAYLEEISDDGHLSSYHAEKVLPAIEEAAEGDSSPDVQALARRIAEKLKESTKRRR